MEGGVKMDVLFHSTRINLQVSMKSKKYLKAKVNQQIHTSTIPKLKQGIDSVYVTIDFIYIGIVELCGTPSKRELQNEISCPQGVLDPGTSRRVIHCAMSAIYRFIFKGKLNAHILQHIKTNQSKGGNILNFKLYLIIYMYCDLNVTMFS